MIQTDAYRRFFALTKKELQQLRRDKSSLLLGIVLPLLLIFIIGYGMSLDVKNVPTAVVMEDISPTAKEAVNFLDGSEYFAPTYVFSLNEAEEMLKEHIVKAIIYIPGDFTSKLNARDASVLVILNGVDATVAGSAEGYIKAGLTSSLTRMGYVSPKGISIESRLWFNEGNTSSWFYVPGIIMLILTMVGVFLTSVVMAREWERGTFTSLFVTPVKIGELIVAKTLPYFAIATLGMLLCLLAGNILYDLPMRGSLIIIIGVSMLYILVALGIGLVISSVTKNQFLACQAALLVSFLPSVILSGFMFDMHSEPLAIQIISRFIPTTYYLELIKSLILSGNYYPLIIKNSLVLALFAVLFIGLALKMTRKEVA